MNFISYLQYATGGIDKTPVDLQSGIAFQAARTVRIAREYFLEEMSGFKQLVKIPGVFQMYRTWKNHPIVASSPLGTLCRACEGAKKVMSLTETVSKLKKVFKPLKEDRFAKAGEIAEWTMSVAESYKWLAKIGFVAARAWTINVVFNVASGVLLFQLSRVELAKWTGEKGVSTLEKVKSLFVAVVIAAYTILTAVAVAEMAGYVVASSATLSFACAGVALTATIGGHFVKKLFSDET